MITQTSENAIKGLVYLAIQDRDVPITPAEIATHIGCSPTYLSKVMGQLVKAGILRSQRGPQGGMVLALRPDEITLLNIVEACQGVLVGAYCRELGEGGGPVCAFHEAMCHVHHATVDALRSYTLKDLAERPLPTGELKDNRECRMRFIEASDKYRRGTGKR